MPDIEVAKKTSLSPLQLSRRGGVVAIVSGVVAIGILLGGELFTPSEAIAPPAVTEASPSTPGLSVHVHVAGAVRSPGLHVLPTGARVADAIEAAGGPRRDADLDGLNLAQVLMDGTRIEVLRKGDETRFQSADAGAGTTTGPLSLNRASSAELEQLPGIGPVRAAAIVAFRAEHGGFTTVEDLLEVSGIGPAIFEALREHVSL